MTLDEIKLQTDEMLQIKENTTRYREQVENLENEINQLEKEVADTLDFDKDVELQEKKERLPKFKERLAQAEKNEKAELRNRGMKLNIVLSKYQKEEMKSDTDIQETYETAQRSLVEAYENIKNYEEKRMEKASELVNAIKEIGYDEAMKSIDLIPANREYMILEKVPSKLNLQKGTGNGRNQSVKQFLEEITKESD